jgi:undecaprenyl-diphosphatase
MLWLVVVALGLLEGLTEFIPVSSTGHLLLADHFFGFERLLGSKEKADVFDIAIQAGAILAVGWIYRIRLLETVAGTFSGDRRDRRLFFVLMIAFLPAAIAGLLFHKLIEAHLFFPVPVAAALVVGGIAIAVIERLPIKPHLHAINEIDYWQGFVIGVAQMLSLFPGVSRSGATIMGGLCAGLDRRTSTEFSFLLAVPIMMAATGFDLLKNLRLLDASFLGIFAVGFVTAFVSALLVVRWFIRYVQRHNFELFAAYRVILGAGVIAFLWLQK